ncbi:hypothetical protein N0V82_002525 [Gnomoniopsis sp. IMI 355080]|nr:hypothetical protein N0V82_002525 [Gnomoniopsis sp. IMI 355080]
MLSRSASSTRSSQTLFTPCFPSAEGSASLQETRPLPLRPRNKAVFDPDACSVPLLEFDYQKHTNHFPSRQNGLVDAADDQLPGPAKPEGFSDEYLMPSLTRNERLRLTMLWYYTNGLLQDEDFLARLQEKLDLVQTFFADWEFAIMGLVFEDAFTRIATAGMPLAVVPRRESPCSHTINQEPGTVFMLQDMSRDWRFRQSPVAQNGLRGYAGAQLRCVAPTGESVALGSLCIASNSEKPLLTLAQQKALVRFADMLSAEIVGHSREGRRRQRLHMAQLLAECRLSESQDAETHILDVIRQVYPAASVKFIELVDNAVPLPNHEPVDPADVIDGLWEDAEVIEELIKTNNHTRLTTSISVRAIIHPVNTFPIVRYLVVASTELQTVLDDVDSWFVEKCAVSLGQVIQQRHFSEALMIKERFLRGITHQLRTPIHGVLGSCELLAEELSSRNLLEKGTEASGATASTILNAIRDSGKELMSTVNNMLKLNRWAETTVSRKVAGPQDWSQFEDDILYEVDQAMPDHEPAEVSIFFNNNLASEEGTSLIDMALLKECVQSLVLNSLQATKQGAVVIAIDASADRSLLTVDVMDSGCGIAPADHARIFEAYEKVDIHSRGAGLGLTLAANIAKLMQGDVVLVSSSQSPERHGSHFRATIATPFPTSPRTSISAPSSKIQSKTHDVLPFYLARGPDQVADLLQEKFAAYLEQHGFQRSQSVHNRVALLPCAANSETCDALAAANPAKLSISLTPAAISSTQTSEQDTRIRLFPGPFTSSRLKQILVDIKKSWENVRIQEASSWTTPTLESTKNGQCKVSTNELLVGDTEPSVETAPFALLVDDNVVNLKILQMYCLKRGIEHITAINGEEAVDRFTEQLQAGRPLNLILMDLQMPVCDGLEAVQRIRSIERKAEPSLTVARAPSRIFMVTGQDSSADKARSFAAGADEFFVKPMGMKKLDLGIVQYFGSSVFQK